MSNNNKPVGPSGKPASPNKGERTPQQNLDQIKNKDALQDVKVPKNPTTPVSK